MIKVYGGSPKGCELRNGWKVDHTCIRPEANFVPVLCGKKCGWVYNRFY
ncbi:MAG: hypothetical protein WAT22_00755 [Saprospiraceae bacterium]